MRTWCANATEPSSDTETSESTEVVSEEQGGVPTATGAASGIVAASAGVQAVLQDISDRPEYYLSVTGVILGTILTTVVLSASLVALDTIPLVPDFLRIIGLAYVFWFLSKYLFSGAERVQLQREIDDLLVEIRTPETKSESYKMGLGASSSQMATDEEA